MVDHTGALQFVNTTTGDWIPAMMQTLLFDVIRARENANRTLQIKTWPVVLSLSLSLSLCLSVSLSLTLSLSLSIVRSSLRPSQYDVIIN